MGADSRWDRKRFAATAQSIGLLLALLAAATSRAATHPEVAIVVNAAAPMSVAIGEAYRRARDVPEANLLRLDVPLRDPSLSTRGHETISRARYRRLVRDPVANLLRERDPDGEIRILVLAKGIPLRIREEEQGAHGLERTAASVDAELAVLFSPLEGSAGTAGAANPYFRAELPFAAWRDRHPEAPLRYLVARLTGYPDSPDPDTGVPRDVASLIARAQEPAALDSTAHFAIDENPDQDPAYHAGNLMLHATASALGALGAPLIHERSPAFLSDVAAIAGYASWGSNDRRAPPPPYYGRIRGRLVPGRFAARAIAVTLVSSSARTFTARPPKSPGQSLIADLIRLGAAGASGHVYEPMLAGVVRPILLVDYARGVPAGEAFFRSVPYLSWTHVYVGDPLMRVERPLAAVRDSDGDGVPDALDGCRELPEARQRDSDGDGFGDLCDGDFDGDGLVGLDDLAALEAAIGGGPPPPGADLDGDGVVDARDLSIASTRLHLRPGPGPAGRGTESGKP